MKKEIRYCNYCKKLTVCQHDAADPRIGFFTRQESCDCDTDGIVFTSIKTSIHQDCLIEMMEKVLEG